MGRIQYPRLGLPENKGVEDAYFQRMRETDGFDLSGVRIPAGAPLVPYHIGNELLVKLYAKLGLHRYNLLKGGNWELVGTTSCNQRSVSPTSFYITLDARDATTGIEKVFQVKVIEFAIRSLNSRCTIVRPRDEPHPPLPPLNKRDNESYEGTLPDWPQSEDAFSDTSRFYVVKDSEVRANSWIRLYLQLAVATHHRSNLLGTVAHLKIMKVVIETDEPEPLKANSVTVYIKYKNTNKIRIGKATTRIAIVRRFFNEATEHFVLLGETGPVENTKRSKTVNERRLSTSAGPVENTDEQPPKKRRVSTRTRKPMERFGC